MKGNDYLLSQNKLIILFMLNEMNLPMTNSQISDYILKKDYTNYFSLQQSLSELSKTDLIIAQFSQNSTRYSITDNGKKTLNLFVNRIPNSIQEDIINYLKKNKHKLRSEVEITSDYTTDNNGEYIVHCIAKENETVLIDLKINALTKEQSILMCANWRERAQDIYSKILLDLLK